MSCYPIWEKILMWIDMQCEIGLKMEGDSWETIINTSRVLETHKILNIVEFYILMLLKYLQSVEKYNM